MPDLLPIISVQSIMLYWYRSIWKISIYDTIFFHRKHLLLHKLFDKTLKEIMVLAVQIATYLTKNKISKSTVHI